MSTLLRNCGHVVTLDDDARVLTDVDVLIEDGRIAAIGPALAAPQAQVVDGRHRLVMPGLVNLHTHLAMTLLRGLAEDVDLQGFLTRVMAAEGAIMDAPTVALGTSLGVAESLLGGVTMAADMYFHPAEGRAAAAKAGMRLATGPTLLDFEGPDHQQWDQRLSDLATWPSVAAAIGGPEAPTVACPHSTYLVSPEHLAEIGQAIRAWDRPVLHIHVSENRAENAQVLAQTGRTPVQVLTDAGLLDGDLAVVFGHGIHLTEADRQAAKLAATVAHCPGSNLKLASGALDWVQHRQAGLRVGIGTDGTSSSNDLDMWMAMRLAALVARLSSGRPDAVSSVEILRAATQVGATALGMGDRLGRLEVGAEADLILLDTDSEHLTPIHDVHALLVFAAGRSDVTDVFVAGEHVVANRELTRVDAEAVRGAARERALAAAAAAGGAS